MAKNMAVKEIDGLVRVHDIDDTIVIDLKYATGDNFTKKKVYPESVCLLQRKTAEKLAYANREFGRDGYRIKIWDAYRPLYVQKIFWDMVPDTRYVADPKTGSKHNCGTAVDITLVDLDGKKIDMPTGFDDFSDKASRLYRGNSKEVQKNLDYLTGGMSKNGFITIDSEWWHFQDENWDSYHVLDVKFDVFL